MQVLLRARSGPVTVILVVTVLQLQLLLLLVLVRLLLVPPRWSPLLPPVRLLVGHSCIIANASGIILIRLVPAIRSILRLFIRMRVREIDLTMLLEANFIIRWVGQMYALCRTWR